MGWFNHQPVIEVILLVACEISLQYCNDKKGPFTLYLDSRHPKYVFRVFGLKRVPIGSMYGIFTYIYHKNQPNVGKYTIHGWYGVWSPKESVVFLTTNVSFLDTHIFCSQALGLQLQVAHSAGRTRWTKSVKKTLKINEYPLKRDYFNRKYIFHPTIDFSGDMLVFRGIVLENRFLFIKALVGWLGG